MSANLRIALRFLTARRGSMAMSLACIVLGVGLFVVTQATTSGFERFFIRTVLGADGAIRIEDQFQDTMRSMSVTADNRTGFHISQREAWRYVEGVAEPRAMREALAEWGEVTAISEVVAGSARLRGTGRTEPVRVFGLVLEDHLRVSDLGNQIVQGDLEEFRAGPNTIMVGRSLTQRAQVELGDWLQVEAGGEVRRYRLAAIYETGITELDRSRVFLHLAEARSLLRRPAGATFLQLALRDPGEAEAVASDMERSLGHSARPWQERERTWLEVFRALRLTSAITVSVFTAIAGLAMFNTLAMIVLEKTREIAILRAMGYTRRDISEIFLWLAGLVLVGGTVLGWGLGAGITYGLSHVPIRIRGIFATDTFVVNWSLSHYVTAAGIAVVVVLLASLVPARRAARLEPGAVIRGSGQ